MPVERFKLAVNASLIGNRVTRVQPLLFDSAQLGAGEGGERPATERFGDAKRRDNRLMLASRSCPLVLKLYPSPAVIA